MICAPLTNAEKLAYCIETLALCLYKLYYDKQCGYGERVKDCMVNIADTLTAVAPEKLQEIEDKVNHDLFYGVDTNAGRSTNN